MARETEQRVFIAFINGAGQLMCIRRGPGGNNPNQLGLPGGHIDEGETLFEAADRELHEELGLKMDVKNTPHIHFEFKKRTVLVMAQTFSNDELKPSPAEVAMIQMMTWPTLCAYKGEIHKSLQVLMPWIGNVSLYGVYQTLQGTPRV